MTVLSGALKPYHPSFIFTGEPFRNKLILFGMSTSRRNSGMENKVGRRFGKLGLQDGAPKSLRQPGAMADETVQATDARTTYPRIGPLTLRRKREIGAVRGNRRRLE